MDITVKAFGAYDVRGIYPETINEEIVYRVGRAFPIIFKAKKVAVGHDVRLSSVGLKEALVKGLTESGCDVIDLAECATEMIYFATAHLKLDGGIMVTASHNPKEYNGLKLVKKDAMPISEKSGLTELKNAVAAGDFVVVKEVGKAERYDIMDEYIAHLLSYINLKELKPYRLVANTGNGAGGPLINAIEKKLPFDIIKVNNIGDGNFPNGVPNPLLVENRAATAKAVIENDADLGIAWDGDVDRCFLFDEKGEFIEGYYLVGLLAESFLKKNPGAKIIGDSRLYWNTKEICDKYNGTFILSRSGHSFIKAKMREEGAIYGGEMSAHNYFAAFSYADSGMIPWLLVLELLSHSNGKTLSALVADFKQKFPVSGEINTKVKDAKKVLAAIEKDYADGKIDKLDGLSVEFDNWRFNLRASNTEPLLRLNVETRGDKYLLDAKTAELLAKIRAN